MNAAYWWLMHGVIVVHVVFLCGLILHTLWERTKR